MQVFTIDFETYYDADYTLRKMTTEAYVRDPRFEAHGCAVTDGTDSIWLSPQQLASWLPSLQRPVCLIAHHAHFDGLILSHHFNYRPDQWVCTLSMGRYLFNGLKNDLGSLAERFNLSPKSVPYDAMKGRHWTQMPSELQQQIMSGALHDCFLTHSAAGYMIQGSHQAVPYPFPTEELPVVDATIRMFTEPVLFGDINLLGEAWHAENVLRQDLFARLGVSAADLRKDDVFAELLEALGVEPELKITGKGNEKYAFAKSDYFMQNLVTDPDPDIALLAEARLKAQSSIYMTRVERYGDMALRGPLCIYLAYAAAHTRRWGGGDKTNFQNLPRPDPAKPQKGALRRAIKAP